MTELERDNDTITIRFTWNEFMEIAERFSPSCTSYTGNMSDKFRDIVMNKSYITIADVEQHLQAIYRQAKYK